MQTTTDGSATVLVLGNPAWDTPFNAAGAAAAACDGRTIAVERERLARTVNVVGDGDVPLVWHDDADDRSGATGLGHVMRAVDRHRADAVLTLGRARLGPWFQVATVARNQNAAPAVPDARGEVRNPNLPPGAPGHYPRFHHGTTAVALPVTVPAEAIAAAITALGETAVLSKNAGLYLCEDLLFGLLYHAARGSFAHPVRMVGCLHLPRLEEEARGPEQDKIERCVLAAIEVMAKAL